MAQVFLSYEREDGAKAGAIASALDKAGHSVWWDRHIKSGAQYSKEIEAALKAADAVVVLWSQRSVESAWVRDEAAAGRDTGRLVPVRLDQSDPPLGFRQYQTTDLSRWKGKANAPALQELMGAVEILGGAPRRDMIGPAPKRALPQLRLGLVLVVVAALVTVGLVFWRPWATSSSPVVAVVPTGESPSARSMARDLFAKLGNLQSTKTEALHLVSDGTGRNADLTFEVESAGNGRAITANLVLLGGKERAFLWSEDFEQPEGNRADLQQQLAFTAGKVLECALEALTSDAGRLRQETLKLHLNGCAGLSLAHTNDPEPLLPILRRVTEEAPNFEGGWANLLRAEILVLQAIETDDTDMRRRIRTDINRARRINPVLAETFLAEGWLLPPRPIDAWMRLAEKAVETDPDNSVALENRSLGYQHVGRMKDAVRDAQRAVQFDPLSPSARNALASAYAFAGQLKAAEAELGKAERLWPGASSVRSARLRIDLRYGDPRRALALLDSGEIGFQGNDEARAFMEARIDRTPAKVERALNEARAFVANSQGGMSTFSQSLAEFGRVDELVRVLLTADPNSGAILVLFRPQFRDLHRDRRFMQIAQRLELIPYWRETGKWPDFCSDPDHPYDCKAEAAKLR